MSTKGTIKVRSKPETELLLDRIQKQFLESRSSNLLLELYKELFPYIRSLLLRYIKNKIYLSPEVVSSTAQDISLLIVDKYRNKENFRINASFGGYIRYKILEILYAPQKVFEEKMGSLNAVLSSDQKTGNKSMEIGDLAKTLKFEYLFPTMATDPDYSFKIDTSVTIESIWTVFEKLNSTLNTSNNRSREIVLIYCSICLFFEKDPQRLQQFQELQDVTEETNKVYDLALLEIKRKLTEQLH